MLKTLAISLLLQVVGGDVFQSARLVSVVDPVPPPHVIAGNSVLSEVSIDFLGHVKQVRILAGNNPFIDAAKQALREWTFSPARVNNHAVESKAGVLVLFRPAAFGNFAVGGPSLGFTPPVSGAFDQPAMPIIISDPGYPAQSTAMGVVVLELTIDGRGRPVEVRTVRNVPSLTEVAIETVRNWKYAPAERSGRSVEGKLIVAISFLRPVLTLNE